jgi:hypothetical protein
MADTKQNSGAEQTLIDQARLVVYRLERVSADSIWAHRSSGLRGGLLRWIDRLEIRAVAPEIQQEIREADLKNLEALIASGYDILERAAREKLP